MTRKVIQVVSDPRALVALCDDGTMWHEVGPGWQQILGPTERTLAAEIVAELRAEVADLARHNWNAYIRDRTEALNHAADLVAEKFGVTP